MFNTITKKALCLSLFISLTSQISAECSLDDIKKLMPFAVVVFAGYSLYTYGETIAAFAYKYCTQNDEDKWLGNIKAPVKQLRFASNQIVNVENYYFPIDNKYISEGSLDVRIEMEPNGIKGRVVANILNQSNNATQPNVVLFTFIAQYSPKEKEKTVTINKYDRLNKNKDDLTKFLYAQFDEQKLKECYVTHFKKTINYNNNVIKRYKDAIESGYLNGKRLGKTWLEFLKHRIIKLETENAYKLKRLLQATPSDIRDLSEL